MKQACYDNFLEKVSVLLIITATFKNGLRFLELPDKEDVDLEANKGVKELKSNFRCADCILVNQIEQTALHIDSCITKPDLTMAERYFTPKVGLPYLWSPVSICENNASVDFPQQSPCWDEKTIDTTGGLGRQQQHPNQPHPHWAHQKLEPPDNCQPYFSVLPTYSDNRRQQHQQPQNSNRTSITRPSALTS
ncbi:hypothetical protein GQX74_011110 [Glossina fuscipes]|nr:hypothetical protein GQX74_011110 [Glossina fuscipes]